ncbi:MAG: 16S rRNA (cytosine(1402)-N(4))-methyltransferase RsmH [Deltaproteobacteria bacterium]|jgi:16S rRNA (cytosine1402-N4)-methyltransferase|nr:16S rRNA (cytosine(1402)-N(4))-methyltransferase RsmH [Deltaproteobacteria bacterium]
MTFAHRPVLAQEVIELMQPQPGWIILDGTIGGAGHARLLLEASAPTGRVIGLDRDQDALSAAALVLAPYHDRVILRQGNFGDLSDHLRACGLERVDGILFDLGVSSYQLDSPERGFSFQADGPLDMRMDPSGGRTAAQVIATESYEVLRNIFRQFGEERWAGRIAKAIVKERQDVPLTSTRQLADLICRVVPVVHQTRRIHPATRVFQALRIFVNGELDCLEKGLQEGMAHLSPKGRMAVISFHSLEDRMVKRAFRSAATGCICPPRLPVCACNQKPLVKLLTSRGIRATETEVQDNPRARSATLRGVERLH